MTNVDGLKRNSYHTHTWRCNHASGTEEEYILRAIEAGVTELGFSDHTPYPMPNGYCSGFRMKCEQTAEYFETLRALREKYKDKIKIHIGFETEYYPLYFKDYLAHVSQFPCEYLILGQHVIGNENTPDEQSPWPETTSVQTLDRFVDQVCEAMETGAFTYVAHPDVLNFVGDADAYQKRMRRICEKAKELRIPLEINGLGIRDHRQYPNPLFWEVVAEVGNDVIFGCDAHDVKSAWDEESFQVAQKMAKDLGLHLIDSLEIKTK